MMNKSFITNSLSVLLIVVGYYSPIYSKLIFQVGLFAFSGAITNWLAIHMLFEKVPLLYGSGVIPMRFNEFKCAIKDMVMEQFFHKEHIEKVIFDELSHSESLNLDIGVLLKDLDLDELFQKIVMAIMESPFSGMLSMLGGEKALESLRVPFKAKVLNYLEDLGKNPKVQENIKNALITGNDHSAFVKKIETLVDTRLEELTPQKVKEIVQKMIKEHLGWLVVWGGVFGGLIGAITSLI